MSTGFKTCLCALVLLLSAQHSSAQLNADIEWYERFFEQRKSYDAQVMLKRSTDELNVATANQDTEGQAQAYKAIGLIQNQLNEYGLAMDYFIKALVLEDSLGLKNKQIFSYLAIARVFEEVGNYHRSAEFLEQALVLNEEPNNKQILVLILNQLGKVNAALGRIDKAFGNYERVLQYKEELRAPKAEAQALFNLGNLYMIQRKYTQALDIHKKALQIWRSIDDKRSESISLNMIGQLYQSVKNYDRALANHVAALEIQQDLDDKTGIAVSYNNIGMLYYEQNNFERAIANLDLGLKSARESQSQDQIRKSYEYLVQCYTQRSNYKLALYYNGLLNSINELIQSDRNERQLLETESRYAIDKKESEIDKLESEKTKREKKIQDQTRFRNVLYIVIALIFIIVVLILYLYLQKKRTNKILEATNEKIKIQNHELHEVNATKDKFFSIISHDLKGPLNSLTSFSGLLINHADSLSKEEIQLLAKDLDKSLKNLFALLENLLEWSRSQTGNIDFKPEVLNLSILIEGNIELLQAQAQSKKINLVSDVKKADLKIKADMNSVNTVMRNIISNAIKFTPEGGSVFVEAQQEQQTIEVSIRDTGVGMTPEVVNKLFRIDTKHSTMGTSDEKGTGLGLILCKEFIEKNGGKIWVKSELDKGSIFYFTLPSY